MALAAGRLRGAPAVHTSDRAGGPTVLGEGEHRFQVDHHWAALPDRFTWQTTHNVAVDSEGLVYVIHEGRLDQPDHPAIFVFDPDGGYVRSFGAEFQGGGHGLEVRNEGGQDFLYVAAYKEVKAIAKLDTRGERVWMRHAPMDSGLYAAGEDRSREAVFERDRFMPTNFAFLDDGGFLLADGYGSFRIHRYDRDGEWVSCFGEVGVGPGQFRTPHGLWIDRRGQGEPLVVVADRANARLQWLTLEGQHVRTQAGFTLPANLDAQGGLLLAPDLASEVDLLDQDNRVVARLGRDPEWAARALPDGVRNRPEAWRQGRFVHPHDACFDANGDILVAEWVQTGRVTKLRRV